MESFGVINFVTHLSEPAGELFSGPGVPQNGKAMKAGHNPPGVAWTEHDFPEGINPV